MTLFLVAAILCQAERAAVPPDADQKAALAQVREKYKAEYSARAPKDRVALAGRLLEAGRQESGNAAMRFVLLSEARDLATEGGDARPAFRAIEALAEHFAVEGPAMKIKTLAAAARKSGANFGDLARLAQQVADDALANDRFAELKEALTAAVAHAKKAKDSAYASKLQARLKEAGDLEKRFEPVKQARETLKTTPEDPAANLTLGKYLCFVKEQWAEGLPHLAKSGDAGLQELAKREKAANDTVTRAAAGDAWWDRAEAEQEPVRSAARRRAISWYEKCAGSMTGDARKQVESRLLSWRKERGAGWEDISDPALWSGGGVKEGFLVDPKPNPVANLKLREMPLGEFDGVQVKFRFHNPRGKVGVMPEWVRYMAVIGGNENFAVVNQGDGTKWTGNDQGQPIPTQEGYTIGLALKSGNWIFTVDGVEKYKNATNVTSIKELSLQVELGEVLIEEVKLRYRK